MQKLCLSAAALEWAEPLTGTTYSADEVPVEEAIEVTHGPRSSLGQLVHFFLDFGS